MSDIWTTLKPRLVGAVGAGMATYFASHDWKAASITAATFAIYGAAHASVSGGAK